MSRMCSKTYYFVKVIIVIPNTLRWGKKILHLGNGQSECYDEDNCCICCKTYCCGNKLCGSYNDQIKFHMTVRKLNIFAF